MPCDSHGFQLLMKDISEMPWFAPIFKKAQMVTTYFHKADKQLAILRMYQLRGEQKRVFSITLSCITRWGTQVGLIKSLLRSQMALRLWSVHDQVADGVDERGLNQQAVINAVMTHQSWNDLSDVLLVMEVIHEQQKMSESGKAHLGYVIKRWKTIETHLRSFRTRAGFSAIEAVGNIFLDGATHTKTGRPRPAVFQSRFEKQILDIHWVAYHLDPRSHQEGLQGEELVKVKRFLFLHLSTLDPLEAQQIRIQLCNFKRHTDEFRSTGEFWEEAKNPELFWSMASAFAPQ